MSAISGFRGRREITESYLSVYQRGKMGAPGRKVTYLAPTAIDLADGCGQVSEIYLIALT